MVGDLAAIEQDGERGAGRVAGGDAGRPARGPHHPQTAGGQAAAGPFRYFDKGSFAVIGRGAAVGSLLNRLQLTGLLAWLGWLFIHLYFLIGFRNRLLVLIDWAYSYLFFRRGARLITGEDRLDALLHGAPTRGSAAPDAARPPAPARAPSDGANLSGGVCVRRPAREKEPRHAGPNDPPPPTLDPSTPRPPPRPPPRAQLRPRRRRAHHRRRWPWPRGAAAHAGAALSRPGSSGPHGGPPLPSPRRPPPAAVPPSGPGWSWSSPSTRPAR